MHTLYHCGKERWNVKTLTDPVAGEVDLLNVQDATVAQLVALERPAALPLGRAAGPAERQREPQLAGRAVEFSVYRLRGAITLAKHESDEDIHMVLSDGGQTMIIESPSPDCAHGSPVAEQIAAVRKAVEERFPAVAEGGREDGLNVPVTVTGVGFFDFAHGQDGLAPNAIELHPILSFEPEG